jgi:hypothetical protein
MTRKAWFLGLAAAPLIFAAQAAQAWPRHGRPPPAAIYVNFGDWQPARFGGLSPAQIGCPGFTPTIISENDGSGNTVSTFGFDSSGDFVPFPTVAYGTLETSYNGPYPLTIRCGALTYNLQVNIVSNATYVKSHSGSVFASNNPDTTSLFQLKTVMGSATSVRLGQSVYLRDGAGDNTATPALNPGMLDFRIVYPSGGYTQGSGRTTIACEHQTYGADADGQLLHGGGCTIGHLAPGSATDTAVPVDFRFLSFDFEQSTSYAGGLTQPTSVGYGYGVYNSSFKVGPTNAYLENNGACLKVQFATVENNHYDGCSAAIVDFYPSATQQGLSVIPTTTISGNVFKNLTSDAIDIAAWNYEITGNLVYAWNVWPGNPVVGMSITVGGKVYAFEPGGTTADGTVPIGPSAADTMFNLACTINANGAAITGNFYGGTKTCVAGTNYPVNAVSDVNVTASWSSTSAAELPIMKLTSFASGPTQIGSTNPFGIELNSSETNPYSLAAGATVTVTFNPSHPDDIQHEGFTDGLTHPIGEIAYNKFLRSGTPDGGITGQCIYFGNSTGASRVGSLNIHNNICNLTAATAITLNLASNPNVWANTFLSDVASNSYDPSNTSPPTGYNQLYQPAFSTLILQGTILAAGGSGGTFNSNVSNIFGALQTGATASPAPNKTFPYSTMTPAQIVATYQTAFPAYPSGYITTLHTCSAALGAFVPSVGGAVWNGDGTGGGASGTGATYSGAEFPDGSYNDLGTYTAGRLPSASAGTTC